MSNNLRNKEKGFTIVEVMIVIAIAGLILLIVFLAVPALQRNSRNTQRKNDVSALIGAINEYSSNHNGSLPDDYTTDIEPNVQLGFYDDGSIDLGDTWPTTGAEANADALNIAFKHKCDGEDGVTDQARAASILYYAETSETPEKQCDGS
jgi:prepilin-type N-terminal cleavage/methylation domain-containing protein